MLLLFFYTLMPEISKRGMEMPESPIRKLVPYAEEAKKRGIRVFHLNIGQPDIKSPDVIFNRIKGIDLNLIEYRHSAGFGAYREKLSAYYTRHNIKITAQNILVTTGGSEAILFGFLSCLNAGDEVIIPEPFYTNYNGFACAAGIKITPVTSKIEDGFALPPISAFEKKITSRTKAIMICNPNNPTGYLYSEEELELLKQLAIKHDLFLFSDEVYREFCYDGNVHFSAMNLKGADQHVILIDSVSKRYSMCGARVGALISRNNAVLQTALKYAQARLSPPTLGQIAAEAAIDTPAAYFEEVQSEYALRRDLVVNALNKMKGVYCPKPGGSFYVIAQLPIDDTDRFCRWLLEDFSYKNQTVMLAPATGFYASPGMGKNEARIAYVLNIEDLAKAMECLDVALKQYPGKRYI